MVKNLREIIKKELEKYNTVKIDLYYHRWDSPGKIYTLYVVPELCIEDINLYEGFLFVETTDGKLYTYIKRWYMSPVEGYAPRIGIVLFKNKKLLIKDFRRNIYIEKQLKEIDSGFLNRLQKAIRDPSEKNLCALCVDNGHGSDN